MKIFEVDGGVLKVPAGTVMKLNGAQLATRSHNVTIEGKPAKDGSATVTAKRILQFKIGEVVQFESDPDKIMGKVLKPWIDPKFIAAQARAQADAEARLEQERETKAQAKDQAVAALAAAKEKLADANAAVKEAASEADKTAAAANLHEVEAEVERAQAALDALEPGK